jgi:hypothetical protein
MSSYEEVYIIFNNILSGCRTMIDAFYFAEKIIQINQSYRDLLAGMIHNKKYDKIMDMRTIAHTLNELNNVEYREDIDEYINKNMKNNIDTNQINTFLRFGRNKPVKNHNIIRDKPYKISLQSNIFNKKQKYNDDVNSNLITKHCPHCKITTKVNSDAEYIICGYANNNKGYDWDGCGKDWCARCERMLCKTWDKDKLFVNFNRIHNATCCKEYAERNELSYDKFCQCSNVNVKRELKDI